MEGCDQRHLRTARARLLGFQTYRQPALHTTVTEHKGKGCQTPSQPGLALFLEGGGGYSQPKRHDCFSSGVRTRCRDSSGSCGAGRGLWGRAEGSLASVLKVLVGEDHKENKQLLKDPRPEAGE